MDDLDRSTVPGPNAPPFEQIALALIGAVDPEKPPPEKGVWRQVLRLTGLKGPAHHVGWLLYGRSNRHGRVPPLTYQEIATDGGISAATVKRGITAGERGGAWKRTGRRGKGGNFAANGYALNLGGRFTRRVYDTDARTTVGHTDPRPWVTQTDGTYVGLPYEGQSSTRKDTVRTEQPREARERAAALRRSGGHPQTARCGACAKPYYPGSGVECPHCHFMNIGTGDPVGDAAEQSNAREAAWAAQFSAERGA